MKKSIIIIIIAFLIIMSVLYIYLKNVQSGNKELQRQNSQYESYLTKNINGTDLATLINKAIDNNEQKNVKKDKEKYYIENDETSLIIKVKMHTVEKTYSMEDFYNNDITKFVQNFNQIEFKCTNVEYNKLGKVSKLIFEEILEEKEKIRD